MSSRKPKARAEEEEKPKLRFKVRQNVDRVRIRQDSSPCPPGCDRKPSEWNKFVKSYKGTAVAGDMAALSKLYRQSKGLPEKPVPCAAEKQEIERLTNALEAKTRALEAKKRQLAAFLQPDRM